MMTASDAVWIAAITAASGAIVAITNMIGSVCMLYIRAKYQYQERTADKANGDGIRDLPTAGTTRPH